MSGLEVFEDKATGQQTARLPSLLKEGEWIWMEQADDRRWYVKPSEDVMKSGPMAVLAAVSIRMIADAAEEMLAVLEKSETMEEFERALEELDREVEATPQN